MILASTVVPRVHPTPFLIRMLRQTAYSTPIADDCSWPISTCHDVIFLVG